MTTRLLAAAMVAGLLVVQGSSVVGEAQPGPEQKKLEFLVGKWRLDTDIKATATTPASKASGTEDCEMFANLHIVCRAEITGAAGLYKTMRVISYVPALKSYSSYTIDSLGYAVLALGQNQGDTWTFTSEVAGYKTRLVMKVSRDSYTSSTDYSGPDGKWLPTSTGKATRAK